MIVVHVLETNDYFMEETTLTNEKTNLILLLVLIVALMYCTQ